MFLYMLAFMLTSVIENVFYIDKACRVNHGHPAEVCNNLDLHKDVKRTVQVKRDNFQDKYIKYID